MNVIRSRRHEVFSEKVNKIALSSEDDKRVIMEDGIHTKAFGHYSLGENNTSGSAIAEGLREALVSGFAEILQLQNISLENPIIICVILCLAVLIQYQNVTDTHTQSACRRTDT